MEKTGAEWEEYNNASKWMVTTIVISLVITIILGIISIPLGYLLGNGISKDSLNDVTKFIQIIANNPGYLISRYANWIKQITNYHGEFSLSLWLPILPIISTPIGIIIGAITNPYHIESIYMSLSGPGSGRALGARGFQLG